MVKVRLVCKSCGKEYGYRLEGAKMAEVTEIVVTRGRLTGKTVFTDKTDECFECFIKSIYVDNSGLEKLKEKGLIRDEEYQKFAKSRGFKDNVDTETVR